jgi:tagaturonate epimerase
MPDFLPLEKFSIGIGDRFGRQGSAQLQACRRAANLGVIVVPVWNKSHREHVIIGSQPSDTRAAADRAVRTLGWAHPHHVDADHIRRETVDPFIPCSDFFTIDVADWIGQPATPERTAAFVGRHQSLARGLEVPGIEPRLEISEVAIERAAQRYLVAIEQAGQIYRHIAAVKSADRFVTEVSMDETDTPQSPADLLMILRGLADEGIPLQTIAPRFSGRFNKGVDYVGDVGQFGREFAADLAVVSFAAREFGLPERLKVSVHSGSDKFSLYPAMRRALDQCGGGLHLKTAGTTWLEELLGLAASGGEALALVKAIYAEATTRQEELCAPYASVIDIDPRHLPDPSAVSKWTSEQFVSALRHDRANPEYNPHLRQLLHVGYKVAAGMGQRYLDMLDACAKLVGDNVTRNLFENHLKPLFL